MSAFPIEGGCDCRFVRYRLESKPLFVHCCHCRWCQRETGSAFALNAMIESDRMTLLSGAPEIVDTPSNSAGPVILFVRIGTLDDPDLQIGRASCRERVCQYV